MEGAQLVVVVVVTFADSANAIADLYFAVTICHGINLARSVKRPR
jgi:hypothetical protein